MRLSFPNPGTYTVHAEERSVSVPGEHIAVRGSLPRSRSTPGEGRGSAASSVVLAFGMGMGLSVTLNPNGVGLETALKAPLLSQSGVSGGPTAPLQPLFPIATMAQVALAQPTSAPSLLPLQQPPPTSRPHCSPSPPPSPTRPLLGSSSGSIVGLRGPDSGQNAGTGTGDSSSQGRDSSPELIPSTV
ncbi:hypothetical protein GWK47_016690 [Chionoecetes opilio]|uniref:Uncharacterized protein n=1 Tax=Chionoecetes opilio TaxID=41210 RepID=A0A8J4XRR9_CHIOP|nr:hypothetical protein GWK47_016690 [Chionoecetes opilio]